MPGENGAPEQLQPGVKAQVLMTLKVLGVLFAIFGALWLFETFVTP